MESTSFEPAGGFPFLQPASGHLLADDGLSGTFEASPNGTASRRKFADMPFWEQLASDAGLELPHFATPLTTGLMERWLRRLKIETIAYIAWNGAGLDGNGSSARLSDFIKRNPEWSARAWVGLVIEHRDRMAHDAPAV